MGARLAENGAFYIYTVFVLVYATQQSACDRSIVLDGVLIAAALRAAGDPVLRRAVGSAWPPAGLSVRRARSRRVRLSFFWLLDTGSPLLVWLALVVALVFAHAAMYGPQAAFLSELFGTRVRYSGASLGSQLASVLGRGLVAVHRDGAARQVRVGGGGALSRRDGNGDRRRRRAGR